MEKLKPCPFCGSEPAEYLFPQGRIVAGRYEIFCEEEDCPAEDVLVSGATKAKATKAWNTRYNDE